MIRPRVGSYIEYRGKPGLVLRVKGGLALIHQTHGRFNVSLKNIRPTSIIDAMRSKVNDREYMVTRKGLVISLLTLTCISRRWSEYPNIVNNAMEVKA